jgi:ubiquitin C-terminal hydrolase
MKITIEKDDYQRKPGPGLKGGRDPETYAKLSNIPSDKQSNQGFQDREQEELKQAISNSKFDNYKPKFQDRKDKTVLRKNENQFIGMANLGNTCYFNSMMQILYFSDCFSDKICQYKFDKELLKDLLKGNQNLNEDQLQKLKMKELFLKNGVELIKEIQLMFGKMLQGRINYANPQGVLDHLMEKMTNRKVEVGLQKDLVEFLGLFFECLEAGFSVGKEVGWRGLINF